MPDAAVVLDATPNFAVVQLPGRQFPGSVMQGDSLHALVLNARAAMAAAKNQNADSELTSLLEEIEEQLAIRIAIYEACLQRHGIKLPYFKP